AIIDAPGHKEFLKNMITGASRADAAILVNSADEGVREQSRRHAYLLSMLGIKHLIVVVNKMDLVDYSEKRFREIEQEYRKFLRELGLEARTFIPASAREGENVAQASAKTNWYGAASVLEALDSPGPEARDTETPIEANRFHADLFWSVREPLRVGHLYSLRLATQDVKCEVVSIERVMDSSTLETKSDAREQLQRNEIGRLTIQTRAPLVI